jgi:hypothetical protein
MRTQKRPGSKLVIRKFSAQRLTIRGAKLIHLYTELLRLRQAVRQAELLAKVPKSGSNELRSN